MPRELWTKAGAQGLLCFDVPEEYGGAGVTDFRYNMVLAEELTRAGASGPGFPVHTDIIVPYLTSLGTDEQKQRWLPGCVSGETITAIAMTEPGAGSDLQGIRTTAVDKGDHYVLNGSKTFISNGILADLVIVVARTDPEAGHKGISLLVVERGMAGLRARPQPRQDRAQGPGHRRAVLRRRRGAQGEPARRGGVRLRLADDEPAAGAAVDRHDGRGRVRGGARHVPGLRQGARGLRPADREVPAQPVPGRRDGDRGQDRRVFVDDCVRLHNAGRLDTSLAAMAKWWTTELQTKIVGPGVQLHGGYGYMIEYPVARAFLDSRVQTIYGGTTEIQKEIIGRSLGL